MFIAGIARLDKIITEQQRIDIKNIILANYQSNNLNNETDGTNYYNSFGTGSIPEIEHYYNILTPIVENTTKLKLGKENTYARIYNVDSTLTKHLDREGLDITLSIQIENTTGLQQPVFCEGYDGTVYDASLTNGDAALLRGRDLYHWRDPIQSTNSNGTLICVFFHWHIISGENLQLPYFLPKYLCEQIIEDAEKIGFEKSQVIKDNANVEDHYSRSSFTQWFQDKYQISEMIRDAIPIFGNLKLEGWQLVKYPVGGEFRPHNDCLNKENDRLFTIIIYLNDNYVAGETHFPNTEEIIRPEQGKMVIWKNLSYNQCNPKALHAGRPVAQGTKYILVQWVMSKY